MVGDRVKLLPDIVPYTSFLFAAEVEPDEKARAVLAKAAADREALGRIAGRLRELPDFTRGPIEEAVRAGMAEEGLSTGRVIQPLRAAISGRTVSPGLFESMELLGRERTLERLARNLPG